MGRGFAHRHVSLWSCSWNRSAGLTSHMRRLGRSEAQEPQRGEEHRAGLANGTVSTSIHPRWEQEYRESRDGFGSASVHKLRVRLFSGTGTAWHRNYVCVRSVKSSFPPKICSFTQTTRWEWFLNCTNLRRWRGRGCNIIWMPGKY